VQVTGTCDTVCGFSEQQGPVLLAAGQTKYISVIHTFNALDQSDLHHASAVTFTTNTSNTNVSTYILASNRTFSFRIR